MSRTKASKKGRGAATAARQQRRSAGDTRRKGRASADPALRRKTRGAAALIEPEALPAMPVGDDDLAMKPDFAPGLEGDAGEVLELEAPDLEAGGEPEPDAIAADPDALDTIAPEVMEPGEDGETTAAANREDEVQSFLAMYFRDMAELDVLRPEEEFETAREIEGLEIALWKLVLGFLPGANWTADVIERAMEKPFAPFASYRALAAQIKPKTRASVVKRFEQLVEELAAQLREVDIDRIFIDAVMAEIHRGLRVARGAPGGQDLPFDASGKPFRDFAQLAVSKQVAIKRAKNEFVKANLRLVVSIARRFNHGRLPLADLIQEGNIGLMKAVERYDYRRGFRFSTYASWWIRHAISRALADKGRAVRLPVHMIDAYHRIAKSERELQTKLERPATTEEIAKAAGIEADKLEKMRTFLNESPISLDRPISDDDGRRLIDVLEDPQDVPAPLDQLAVSETHKEMVRLLSHLKPIEADILRKRFGLLNDRERTLKEIGDEYRLSRERVRQLQEQALGKMRKAMAKIDGGGSW